MYNVIDTQTGFMIGTYKTRSRATNKADKLDMIHGAVRYSVQLAGQDQGSDSIQCKMLLTRFR